jgi:hypothetical protein
MSEINMDKAIEIVRSYFSKMTGEEDFISSADVPPMNWIGFDVIEAMEKEGVFVVRCEVKEELFSTKKRRYIVKVDTKGELREVKRENEGENIQV